MDKAQSQIISGKRKEGETFFGRENKTLLLFWFYHLQIGFESITCGNIQRRY